MTADMLDLARRAVACPKWRWMPGMRTTEGIRIVHDPSRFPGACALRDGGWTPRLLDPGALPDLTDPATLGRTGRYWTKEFAGDYQPAMFIDEKGNIAQFDLGPADAALRAGNHGTAYADYERQYRLGNLEAGFRLADMIARGLGVPVQPERVFALYSALAGGSEVKGLHNVAVCYEHGIGVAPDLAKACEFYRRAAELGHFASLHTLGRLAAEDRLTPRNDALGLAALAIAAGRAADDEAALAFVRANQPALVATLRSRMSASKLAEAKALAAARRAALP